jgi:hypothetical protein
MRLGDIVRGHTLLPYKILPRRVDKEIPILSADRAVALVDFVLGEWILERHGKADSAAVAVSPVGCWLDL